MPLCVAIGVLAQAKAEQENKPGVSRICLVCVQVGQSAVGSSHISTALGIFSVFPSRNKDIFVADAVGCSGAAEPRTTED